MEIKVRKLKVKDRKKIYKIVKLLDLKDLNLDVNTGKKLSKAEELAKKAEMGEKVVGILVEKIDEIDEVLFEVLMDLTGLTFEQLEDLDIDEFADLLFKVWEKINIKGLLKRGS